MGAQDNTEKVLRALHVLLSKSESYDKEPSKVIVDKQQMLDLLANLNTCIYQMMEEHELTKRSRDQAEREFRKQGDQIIWDASRKAEDVYAASILYMDEAMNRMQELMREADEKVSEIYAGLKEQMEKEERAVKTDQLDLKSSLQTLVDTEKYLKLIEERNKELEKQKNEGKPEEEQESTLYADRQTGIRVNQEYLDKLGLALEEAVDEELGGLTEDTGSDASEEPDETAAKVQEAEIRVNLDADYFQWKEEQENGDAPKEVGKPRTRAQEKARNKRHRK